jgi:putative ABC transport system permease protein
MRPAWRLAINSLSARASRTLLLVAAVALSAALIAAVSCAMASISNAVRVRLDQTVGRANLRIKGAGTGQPFPESALAMAKSWPETKLAAPRLEASTTWRFIRPCWFADEPGTVAGSGFHREVVGILGTAVAQGIDPDLEPGIRQTTLVQGRLPRGPGEVALDQPLFEKLGKAPNREKAKANGRMESLDLGRLEGRDAGPETAGSQGEADGLNVGHALKLGDEVELVRLLRKPVKLKVVGVLGEIPFGGRWRAFLTLPTLQEITGDKDQLTQVDIITKDSVDPEAAAAAHRGELPPRTLLQTTERVTSGLEKNVRSNDLGFVVATVMSFLAASFIIMTGLSTGVTERMRELSILRCIGASRGQLALSQLIAGALIGAVGAVPGIPLGVAGAAAIIRIARDAVPNGLYVSPVGLATAGFGAVCAGLIGASFPAWRAARVSPLEGLASRARPPRRATIAALVAFGFAAIMLDLIIVEAPSNGQLVFWGYATVGLPAMFIGYFLLSVPMLMLIARLLGPAIGRLLGLPRNLLPRTIAATPYRYGFTAGAMMCGLALLVGIWTQGHAILRDWLGRLDFPDAFAVGLNLTEESRAKLDALPFVTGTVPITLHNIETTAFGVHALQQYKTTFIAFDPEPFFRLTHLTWIEPTDPAAQERAKQRLKEGGALLVAREFKTAQHLGAGDTFTLKSEGKEYPFEIVGVVTSPGLEIVSKFFSVGDDFTEQAIHAVFGSRKDLKEKLGTDAISMIQIGLSKDISDQEAVSKIRTTLMDAGLLDAGSGRKIKQEIETAIKGTLLVSTLVALFAMIISSFGVANIVIAGIQARQFEFGVLRAVGAQRSLLTRLVLSEAILIALAAGVLGTLMGLQGVLSGQRLDKLLFGLELSVKPPPMPVTVGWLMVFAVTLGAAAPAVIRLARRQPRELLGAMKG